MTSKFVGFFALALLAAPTLSNAAPITIDFEVNPASAVASYSESGVTFTPIGGALIAPRVLSFGRVILGDSPSFVPIRADIVGGASSVTVVLGDDSDDEDSLFLEAYDAANNLLMTASDFMPDDGTRTLTVIASNISWVKFGSVSTINNSSVGVDVFTFDPSSVPEPGTLALLGLGLAGLAASRRRK